VNFLIMDEPTNHLDMRSKKVLQEALNDYSGTFLIVSHDRSFLDPIVNKVLEVRKDGVTVYLGNVTEYLDRKKKEAAGISDAGDGKKNRSQSATPGLTDKERKRLEAERRQHIYTLTKPLKKKMEVLEKKIEVLEKRKTEVEAIMGADTFYQNADRAKTITAEYKDLQSSIEKLYAQWEPLSAEVDKIANTVPLV